MRVLDLEQRIQEAALRVAKEDLYAGESGLFFNGLAEAKANPQAYDAAARKRLRALSFELRGRYYGIF